MADEFKRETDLIDLTKNSSKDDDLFSADIDFMNNYLKNLPDYSKISIANTKQYTPSITTTVRLRDHPTPKPFYPATNEYNSRNLHKASVPSPKSQRKQINPLSKSNSIHTISKRNLGQSIEKETFADNEQKNKIVKSTSSSTIPTKETSDLMGFMRKPSSLMNIFKKLGSQNSPQPSSAQKQLLNNNNNINNTNSNSNVRNNVHDAGNKTLSSRTKSISDFWNENLQQQNSGTNKFGWNYQKIVPKQVSDNLSVQKNIPALNLAVVKKLETIEASKPTVLKLMPETCMKHEIVAKMSPHHHHQHSQPFPKAPSQSVNNFVKKLTESPKLQRSKRLPAFHGSNDLEHEQKLLKSSSNSHIYMNQDDPNYFKNLHKITKSLDNATNNIISNNKSSYKRSMSNTSVPSFLGSSPQQQNHIFFPPNQTHLMMMQPSTAPMNYYPPISYKPPQDFHVISQRSGSKSNIPLCYKYPLSRSSSNTSMMTTNFNGTALGFYKVQDPLLYPVNPQLHQNMINKSSSSSCIFQKTLSQPTHLSKNNDIFAKYKPIVSDNEESESEDDDTSKHSNLSKGSLTSMNKVPAPAPFKKQQQQQAPVSNYPPFTKLNSIQIPINGQLPSAFKNTISETVQTKTDVNIDQTLAAGRKNSLPINNSNSKTFQMTSSAAPAVKNSCNQSSNIFYNFLNPMAAIQTQSINQMHLQQNDSVGCYTPYTKYLSDRKYFDVALHDVCGGMKPEQRRTSKIPTLSELQKAKPMVNGSSETIVIIPNICDVKHDDAKKTGSELVDVNNTKSSNENVVVPIIDPKEILSAFDPYFIADPPTAQPSTSNKLHQLLTTVANEWNNCDHDIAPPTMMSNCKAYQGDRYGSSQYEVVKMNFVSSLLFLWSMERIYFLNLVDEARANHIFQQSEFKQLIRSVIATHCFYRFKIAFTDKTI